MRNGVNVIDIFGPAADYIHRILNGEKPADLPVQEPWQVAMRKLLLVAVDGGATMLARIAVMQALNRGKSEGRASATP